MVIGNSGILGIDRSNDNYEVRDFEAAFARLKREREQQESEERESWKCSAD